MTGESGTDGRPLLKKHEFEIPPTQPSPPSDAEPLEPIPNPPNGNAGPPAKGDGEETDEPPAKGDEEDTDLLNMPAPCPNRLEKLLESFKLKRSGSIGRYRNVLRY